MSEIIIKYCSFAEIAHCGNFNAIVAEYGKEGAIEGLDTNPQLETYYKLESMGILGCIGAFKDADLIGFLLFQNVVSPHHGQKITAVDAVFVTKEYRKNRIGLKFIDLVEEQAKTQYSAGILFSSPINSNLEIILPVKKYKPIRTLFFKKI